MGFYCLISKFRRSIDISDHIYTYYLLDATRFERQFRGYWSFLKLHWTRRFCEDSYVQYSLSR